jgi:hypothetical protein
MIPTAITATTETTPATPADPNRLLTLAEASIETRIPVDKIRRKVRRLSEAGLLVQVGHLRAVRVADLDRLRELVLTPDGRRARRGRRTNAGAAVVAA